MTRQTSQWDAERIRWLRGELKRRTMTRAQRADIETALDGMAMALAEAGLLHEPLRSKYVRAVRCVRDVPGHRRLRSDAGACLVEPQGELA